MPGPAPFADRLKKGMVRIENLAAGIQDEEAMEPLYRSLELTLARQLPGKPLPPASFRFQVTGGKAILFQGKEALPMEPSKLVQLLNAAEVELQPGETIDVVGTLAAWVLRPEINTTDNNLRQADLSLRGMKQGRDRDHAAAQSAESTKIRLRSRMTQLVSALQMAQKEAEAASAGPDAAGKSPEPAPPPPPKPAAPALDKPPTPEVLAEALSKILAAIRRSNVKAAAVGEIAFQIWGSKRPAQRVELLISSGFSQRETVLGAARAEGFQQAPNRGPLNLRFPKPELGCAAPLDLVEATNPFQKQVLNRAQPGSIFEIEIPIATREDMVLLRVGSEIPADRERVVELLRDTQGMDAGYLKKEAMAGGLMDALKDAWTQAKQ
jgi:hypothetical protein